jgi:hypothetical protein
MFEMPHFVRHDKAGTKLYGIEQMSVFHLSSYIIGIYVVSDKCKYWGTPAIFDDKSRKPLVG